MFKNVASQKFRVFAFDSTTNLPKTGDAANITAYISKDYGAVTVLGDTTATEEDATNAKGWYLFDATQAETNFDEGNLTAKSSTANIVVIGQRIATVPANFTSQAISSAGGVTLADGVSHGGTLGSSTATLALSRLNVTSQTSNTAAITAAGNGTGAGVISTGGATGIGLSVVGGGTSGDGVKVTTTSGHGINLAPVGTSKHGIFATGGNGGTSDGISAVAGTGGVPIRGDITGNITGNLSGSAGSVTARVTANTDQLNGTSLTGRDIGASVLLSSGTGTGQVLLSSGTVTTGTNNDKTGYGLAANDSDLVDNGTAQAGASGSITLRSGASATDNLYRGQRVYITGGTGAGQSRIIAGYTGSTKVATIDENWQTNPDATSTYVVKNSRTAKLDSSLQVTAASVQGNVTGSVASVSGSVGSVTGSVASVSGNVGGNVVGSVGSVTGLTASNLDATVSSRAAPSDVLTQVNAALNAAMTEIASDPGATPSLRQAAQLLYMSVRNKFTNTNSAQAIFNDAGSSIMTNTISDDGTTYTRGKFA